MLPGGEGVLTFRTLDEAAETSAPSGRDYERHRRAARAIAEEYFDSDRVLSRLVEEMTATPSDGGARSVSQAPAPSAEATEHDATSPVAHDHRRA